MLQAIIVNHDEIAMKRLRNKLAMSKEIEICRTFLNLQIACEYVRNYPIQLVFLDMLMPEMRGMEVSRLFHQFSSSTETPFMIKYDNYVVQAFDVSALHYVVNVMVSAEPLTENSQWEHESLTQKEIQVVQLITAGLSNKQIADQLNVSTETIKSHIKNVYRKLNVSNRVQALQRAKQLNIII